MKIFKIILLALSLIGVVFFVFAPNYIDKKQNTVTLTATPNYTKFYDSIPFIADLHCDALLWGRNFLEKHNYGHVDLPRMQEANVALQIFTIVSKTPRGINIEKNSDNTDQIALLSFAQLQPVKNWFSVRDRALYQCDLLHQFATKSNNQFRIISTQKELSQFVKDRKKDRKLTAGMLGIEGAHCLENDLANLDLFYKKGVRYIGLAHFFDNEWAGSAHGLNKGGLTKKGMELIQKMRKLNITIDLAHSSQKTISEVLKIHKGPILVSHTGVRGVCNNTRNLTDEQILEIGKHQGLIGIGLWETAVCGTDATATAKSIKYVATKIGVDKVGLGSDFDGAIKAHFDITGLPIIVNALKKEGFSKLEIEQIMGGNIRDFFMRNLPK